MGTMGIKLGMTTMYDQWGDIVPVTVVQLDRVQVVQIKNPEEGNKFYQVQMGIGEKRIKKTNKAMMGHYLKSRVPPKLKLTEFPVSKECLLPIGYMMSPRHYTPGMFVDVAGKTVGHGFQGTIKRHNFARQPATPRKFTDDSSVRIDWRQAGPRSRVQTKEDVWSHGPEGECSEGDGNLQD
jgi:large subunit ribosomal protein L3